MRAASSPAPFSIGEPTEPWGLAMQEIAELSGGRSPPSSPAASAPIRWTMRAVVPGDTVKDKLTRRRVAGQAFHRQPPRPAILSQCSEQGLCGDGAECYQSTQRCGLVFVNFVALDM